MVAQTARRAANPLKKQLESAELHRDRMAKKLASAKSVLAEREDALAELQKHILEQQEHSEQTRVLQQQFERRTMQQAGFVRSTGMHCACTSPGMAHFPPYEYILTPELFRRL